MSVQPLRKVKIVKKRTHRIGRFQHDRFKRAKDSWRKPRGVDCFQRRRFRGNIINPKIGFQQAKKTRHMLPSGFRKLLIRSPKDIELLLMNNRTYCGEIAQCISAKKHKEIAQRAKELNVRLTNANAKVRKTSKE